jgi:hypothetical protein
MLPFIEFLVLDIVNRTATVSAHARFDPYIADRCRVPQ